MSEAPRDSAENEAVDPEDPAPPAAGEGRVRGARRRAARRWLRRGLLLAAGILAASIFTLFTVDVGDISIGGRSLKTLAEDRGSKFLERPLHIGRISAYITPGKFLLENVVVEGPTPKDRPFFSAGQITVDLPWWTLLNQKQLHIDIRLAAWRMVVEKFPDGKAYLPKLTSRNRDGKGFPLKIRGLSVFGDGGEFIYDDHQAPWNVIGRNLKFHLVRANNLNTYVGRAEFTKGTVQIQRFEPMQADFSTQFQVDGGVVRLKHLDLITDGTESHIGGFVNFGRWPEQEYRIRSTVDFSRMRELFFADASFRMAGAGRFNGVFKIFNGGFDLSGLFSSDEAGLGVGNAEWRFPNLNGDLQWTPTSFRVGRADSDFLGGRLSLAYGLPIGAGPDPAVTLTANYDGVDLHRFTRQFGWTALEPQGRMHGHLAMAWPKGRPFREGMQGTGTTVIAPPAGQAIAAAALPATADPIPPEKAFQKFRPLGEFALGGTTSYRFSASGLDFDPSWVATPTTFVKFQGRARGGPADLAFHVTSHDWQNSDRLFAAIMSNFTRPMGGIDVGGRGVFDGVLTKQFNAPRIEGRFAAENMRAFGEVWGRATGDIVVENSYLTVKDGRIEDAQGGRIVTSGRYSLGYPRADGDEEIDAQIRVENMALPPLLRAFTIDAWPITGVLAEADLHLKGKYTEPSGTGAIRLEKATAWDEPFESAKGTLAFEGDGSMRVNGVELAKGPARIKGNAWLSWALGAYSFGARASPADGGGLRVEELATFKLEGAPLTGILSFRASGVGTFDAPSWRIDDGRIPDLYIGDEAIGAVGIRMSLTNNVLTIEEIAAEHDRLHLACNGTVAITATSDASLRCNFTNASLDPYLKFVARELPYTRAIVTGSVSLDGPLRDRSRLNVDARVDEALLTLFDYRVSNDGPLLLAFRNNTFRLGTCGVTVVPGCQRLEFKGEGTSLAIGGTADATTRTINLGATGQASPAVLQAFYPLLSASGDASLRASLTGNFDDPTLSGRADITSGTLRHFDVKHGITEINGPITMEAGRISVDGLRAVIGEGAVEFDGFIGLDGYRPDEFNVEVHGRSMHLRVPEGLQSTVDADLYLRGPIKASVLSGTVDVQRASYSLGVDSQTAYFGLFTGVVDTSGETAAVVSETPSVFPIRLAIQIKAPTMPFVENRTASALIYGSASVDIGGTLDRPIVTGRVEVDRGEWVFSGNRYQLLGGSIDFTNPHKFTPFFEMRAETRVPTPGQAYMVNIRISGTLDKLKPTLTSEPWLPEFQIWSLLLGETPDVGEAELRARSAPQDLQAQALRTAAFAVIASPVSATLGTAMQRVTTIDTVQIVPLLGSQSSVTPSARIILGKRISERVYMMYARTLSAEQNEVIMVMFDQNDRLSWVLSRNEDRTFAVDFRLRFVFR